MRTTVHNSLRMIYMTFDVGDYVSVKRGQYVGMHGEILTIVNPLDGGDDMLLLFVEDMDMDISVRASFCDHMRRP